MRVQFSIVSHPMEPNHWADLEAPPRVGDVVAIPGLSQGETVVRTVVWYPFGDPDEDIPADEPFVYVVLGHPRPTW